MSLIEAEAGVNASGGIAAKAQQLEALQAQLDEAARRVAASQTQLVAVLDESEVR